MKYLLYRYEQLNCPEFIFGLVNSHSSRDDNITLKELNNEIKRQKDESYSEIESVYDSGGSYKPCRDDYHFRDSKVRTADVS
jgi:hypothetical protein